MTKFVFIEIETILDVYIVKDHLFFFEKNKFDSRIILFSEKKEGK